MTKTERIQQELINLSTHTQYARHSFLDNQQRLAEDTAWLEVLRKLHRDTVFELYVSSSHRSFLKFMRENP